MVTLTMCKYGKLCNIFVYSKFIYVPIAFNYAHNNYLCGLTQNIYSKSAYNEETTVSYIVYTCSSSTTLIAH